MILHRDVFLNPVDPQYLALRAASGVDTKVNLHFKTASGVPLTQDVVAQLQLTSRSRNITTYLSCPAVDVVNGVARVTIPADFMTDPNGYNIRLTGTVAGEPRVLAYGVLTQIAGAGPQVEAQDVIDSIDIVLFYGQPTTITVTLWQDAGKGAPYDLSGVSVAADVRTAQSGPVLQSFAVLGISGNAVTISLTAAQVDTLPAACWWDLVVTSSSGSTTLAQGDVSVKTLT
jgi:hypothetical protein